MTFVNVKPMERIIARLRARGFVVNEHPGWRTRGVDGRDMKRAESLLMHHDVSKPPANYPLAGLILGGRGRPGQKDYLKGPLAQWGVGRRGTVEVFAAGLAYHAGRTRNGWAANDRAQGCEAANMGTGTVARPEEPWPAASMAAQRALAEEWMREYHQGTGRIRGHKEEAVPAGRKIDPVYDMDAFRRSLSDKPTIPAVPLPVPVEELMTMNLTDRLPSANPDSKDKSITVQEWMQDVQANAFYAARNTAGLGSLDRDLRGQLSGLRSLDRDLRADLKAKGVDIDTLVRVAEGAAAATEETK